MAQSHQNPFCPNRRQNHNVVHVTEPLYPPPGRWIVRQNLSSPREIHDKIEVNEHALIDWEHFEGCHAFAVRPQDHVMNTHADVNDVVNFGQERCRWRQHQIEEQGSRCENCRWDGECWVWNQNLEGENAVSVRDWALCP